MAKEWAKPFYNSKAWIRCRDSYIAYRIAVDGGVCEECKRQQGYIVHHEVILTPDNVNNPEISLNHKLMKYVCKDCHDMYEGHGVGHKKLKPLCIFDENGQPVSLREIDIPPLFGQEGDNRTDRQPTKM